MTPQRYQQIKRIFAEVCQIPSEQRNARLDQVCAEDLELRREVEDLLAHDEKSLPIRPSVSAAAVFDMGPLDAQTPGSSVFTGLEATAGKLPEQIGRFRVLRKIGQGGMGVVYEAEQDNPKRAIALKMIRPGAASSQILRRFKFEAQVLGRLQHPGIAQVYEAGTADILTGDGQQYEQPYFAMEYIHGRPLSELVKSKSTGTRQRLALFVQICDAVQHAHQKGVIHRDLKPGNILIDESGQPKILDFGVARVTDSDIQMTTLHTDVGQLIGTLPYMSPEQVAGDPIELDTRSDVYALGVLCYNLLTGQLPYNLAQKTIPEAARTITEQEPRPLSSINRLFRGDLDTIVTKALEKDKSRRYQTAADLAADLRRYMSDQPISARPVTALYQIRKFARRNRALVAGLVGIALALIAGITASTALAFRAFDAEQLAQDQLQKTEEARGLAEVKEREASEAAARATTVRDFLVRMLERVNPDVAQGRDVTLLREVLDEAAAELEADLTGYPEVQADLHQVIGTVYRSISVYDEAREHLRTACDIYVSTLGEDDPLTLAARRDYAQALWDAGQLSEAEQLFEHVYDGYREMLGEADRETLMVRYSLAGVVEESGRLDQAEEQLREILELMHAHLDERDDALLDAMNGLALINKQRSKLEEARRLLSIVVERWTEKYGSRHPSRVRALRNLATVVTEMGDGEQAEQLTRESYELHREVFGEDHHSTIEARINLVSMLRELDQIEEAEPLAREALDQAIAVLGPEHPDTLIATTHLGIILRLARKLEEAETLLGRAVTLSEQIHGVEDPRTLNRLSSLAGVYKEQDKLDQAEVIMRKVIDGLRAVHGETSSKALFAMNNLGLLLVENRKLDEAEEMLRSAVELTDKAAPPGHWFRWAVRLSYGECLLAMERFEDAEQTLLECHRNLEEILGAQHQRTRGAAARLAELYEAWGKPEQASKYLEEPAEAAPNTP